HDFPRGHKQKLIPSIYLTIDLEDSNDSLCNSQLSIFICLQWLLSTSSLTYMADIMLIIENPVLNNTLKLENEFKPILVLLVDSERSMSILSEKLAGIVLPIDHFGSHLDSSRVIENIDLAKQNFHYFGERLCDIWQRDYIYSKEVIVKYVDEQINLFNKASDISWG
ncbi:17448_t:CDS:2, partial [Gigaspora margarita]